MPFNAIFWARGYILWVRWQNGSTTIYHNTLFCFVFGFILTPMNMNTLEKKKKLSWRRHLSDRRTHLQRLHSVLPETWQALRTHSSPQCPIPRAICKFPSQLFYCRIFDAQFFALVCYEWLSKILIKNKLFTQGLYTLSIVYKHLLMWSS